MKNSVGDGAGQALTCHNPQILWGRLGSFRYFDKFKIVIQSTKVNLVGELIQSVTLVSPSLLC